MKQYFSKSQVIVLVGNHFHSTYINTGINVAV